MTFKHVQPESSIITFNRHPEPARLFHSGGFISGYNIMGVLIMLDAEKAYPPFGGFSIA
jgi:hypothetical protein